MASSPNNQDQPSTMVLTALEQVLAQRKQSDPNDSYVASLYHKGINKILEKIGEEATETIIAAKDHALRGEDTSEQALVGEVADLWFHSMVMLNHLDIPLSQVLHTLEARFGLSGHAEKAQRDQSST